MAQIGRRDFLRLACASAGALFLGANCSAEKNKPNIVLILADDQGWKQVGCYGSDYYETPNIDKLATQGMLFTDAYAACPVCSPTRASIMTGKYPARLHLTDFIAGGNPPENSRLLHPDWTKYLPLDEITIAEALKKEGYVTASFGKWHLSKEKMPPQSLPYNPDKQGFDESFVTYKPSRGMAQEWQTPENDGHNVEIITQKSLAFMEENKDKPFFLYIPHNTIHTPLIEKEKLIAKYEAKSGAGKDENNPVIAAMTETLDNSVGRIMDKLDELDLAKNTLLIYFSDNGGLERAADQTPLRSGKASLYEGGIRVPFIVRWPGRIKPGSVSHELMTSVDFFPTLLDVVNAGQSYANIDGTSLVPVWTESGSLDRDAIYWHYPHYHGSGEAPCGAIRKGKYKLVEWYIPTIWNLDGQIELFDLENDLDESDNLAEKMPDKAAELRKQLHQWRERVGAQMPVKNPDYQPES
jgi:uncharacterized sulfatase